MKKASAAKKKNKWILLAVILVLAVSVAVLAVLNRDTVFSTLEGLKTGEVVVKVEGREAARFDLEYVKSLPKAEFDDHIKKTGESDKAARFGGVLLKDVLKNLNVDVEGCVNVAYKAVDGYTSAGTVEEVLQDDKVFVVYEKDGKPTGTRSEGGTGPLEIIIAGETFSLRNCKFLMEIDIEK